MSGGSKINSILSEQQDREIDDLDDLVETKLEATWKEISFLKKLSKVPLRERDERVLGWALRFAAARADEQRMTREAFLVAMGAAFDAEMEEDEEEGDEVVAAVTRSASRGIVVDNPLATLEPRIGAASDAKPPSLPMPPGVYVDDAMVKAIRDATDTPAPDPEEPPDPILQVHDTPAAAASFKRATAMLPDHEDE